MSRRKLPKNPDEDSLPIGNQPISATTPDAGDPTSPIGGDDEKPDTSNEQTTPLGAEGPEAVTQNDTAIDISKDDESKGDESKGDDGEPILTVGLMKLRYTGETTISLDASMVGVYRKVTIYPNQLVLLPEMLGRHWAKKPFFTKVD